MTIIKITKSGKALQVIDDEGKVFQTSVNSIAYLLAGKAPFITTVRMPFNVAPGRYKPSEIWTDNGKINPKSIIQADTTKDDPQSRKTLEEKKKEKVYTDKVVDF
jgi:hypothetical protein